jgi:hypothetical protein
MDFAGWLSNRLTYWLWIFRKYNVIYNALDWIDFNIILRNKSFEYFVEKQEMIYNKLTDEEKKRINKFYEELRY